MLRKLVLLTIISCLLITLPPAAAANESNLNEADHDEHYHYEEYPNTKEQYYRGRVLEVLDQEETEWYGDMLALKVLLTSGPFKGEVVTTESYLLPGEPLYDEGQEVIVVMIGDYGPEVFYILGPAHDRGVYYLIGVFVLLLLVLGRMKGLKTVITLIVTIVLIFYVLLPLMLQGHNPILLAILIASSAIVFTLLMIGGVNVKSVSAIIGTIGGVLTAGLMAFWAGSVSNLTGLSNLDPTRYLYFLDPTLDFRGLLFAGIIIGSIGAVTDTGMSIASAAAEIRQANPGIKFRELLVSAMNVGRDVMGTMANTLILAYVGAAIPLLLLFMGNERGWLDVVNMDIIAIEFVRGVAGSIGLVVAVPITAAATAFLMTKDWLKIVKVERH